MPRFLLVLVLSLIASGWAAEPPRETAATAIEELQKLGARLKFDEKTAGKPLISVDLADQNNIQDDWLVHLDALPTIKVLNLRHAYAKITAKGLAHIHSLKALESIDLWDVKAINNDELAKLVQALPNLRELNIGGCEHPTDAGLACLAGNTHLTSLTLTYLGKVTDAGLEHLKGCTGLRNLAVNITKVTPDGIAKLQQALPNCKITR